MNKCQKAQKSLPGYDTSNERNESNRFQCPIYRVHNNWSTIITRNSHFNWWFSSLLKCLKKKLKDSVLNRVLKNTSKYNVFRTSQQVISQQNHIQPQIMGDSFYHMSIFSSLLDAKVPNVTSTVLRYNPLWHHRSGIWKFIPWVMFNAYEGKHMTNIHVSLSLNMTFWIKHIQCNRAYQLQYTLNFIDLTE